MTRLDAMKQFLFTKGIRGLRPLSEIYDVAVAIQLALHIRSVLCAICSDGEHKKLADINDLQFAFCSLDYWGDDYWSEGSVLLDDMIFYQITGDRRGAKPSGRKHQRRDGYDGDGLERL